MSVGSVRMATHLNHSRVGVPDGAYNGVARHGRLIHHPTISRATDIHDHSERVYIRMRARTCTCPTRRDLVWRFVSRCAGSLSAALGGAQSRAGASVEESDLIPAETTERSTYASSFFRQASDVPVSEAESAHRAAHRATLRVVGSPTPPYSSPHPPEGWLESARSGVQLPPLGITKARKSVSFARENERQRVTSVATTAVLSEQERRKRALPYEWQSPDRHRTAFPTMKGRDTEAARKCAANSFELSLSVPASTVAAKSAAPVVQKILRAIGGASLFKAFNSVKLEELSESELPILQSDAQREEFQNPFTPSLRSVIGSDADKERIQRLDDLINVGLDNATADGHRGRRHTGVKAFRAFCVDVLGISPDRPLDPLTTTLIDKLEEEWVCMQFVCALVQDRGITPSSAAVYFSAVQGWHGREHGVKLCAGLKLERLPQMLKGLRRVIGEVPRAIRRGISPAMLKRAMDLVLDPARADHANIRAALAVALQGLLRSREYCGDVKEDLALKRSDLVELTEHRVVIMMHPCKNMHHLGGKTCPLVLGAGGGYVDCVWELNNLVKVDPIEPGREGETFLFRDPLSNRPLSYELMLHMVKTLMSGIGEDPDQFGTHSLRIGGATALFAMGASETLIRTMGRWSSDLHRLYTRACFEQCEEWSRKAGSAEVSDLAGTFDEVDFY